MPHSPISYPGGPLAETGDIVTYHQERSTVEVVIVGDRVSEWGVEEPGLMLQNVSFGRVFVPVSGFDEELSYVSRGA